MQRIAFYAFIAKDSNDLIRVILTLRIRLTLTTSRTSKRINSLLNSSTTSLRQCLSLWLQIGRCLRLNDLVELGGDFLQLLEVELDETADLELVEAGLGGDEDADLLFAGLSELLDLGQDALSLGVGGGGALW
jgi:hypothetical protein